MVVGGEHEYFGELSLLVMVAVVPSVPDVRMSSRTYRGGEPGLSGDRGGTIDCFAGISTPGWVPQEVTPG
jgi:hypothetical protein